MVEQTSTLLAHALLYLVMKHISNYKVQGEIGYKWNYHRKLQQDIMWSCNVTHTHTCHTESSYPSQPRNESLNYHWYEDDREGFEDHVMLNITWDRPCNYESIEHYTLIIFSQGVECGRNQIDHETYRSIPGYSDSFMIGAPSEDRLPKFGCTYQYTVSK